jgi:hypothetical protein
MPFAYAGKDAGITGRNNVFPTERQLVLTAPPHGAQHRGTPIVTAKTPSRRRGVTTMNSLIPLISSVAESRVEEHLASAEQARILRQTGHTGLIAHLRRIAGVMLVRAGERVAPVHRPVAEPDSHQALLRLAR